VETVLRFLSLSDGWETFDGDMRLSLDMYASFYQKANKSKLSSMKSRFDTAISRCEDLWGVQAFRRFEKGVVRDQFMSAMYDAQMISASELTDAQFKKISKKKIELQKSFLVLFKDATFVDSIRVSTNSPSKVLYRVRKVKELLSKFAK